MGEIGNQNLHSKLFVMTEHAFTSPYDQLEPSVPRSAFEPSFRAYRKGLSFKCEHQGITRAGRSLLRMLESHIRYDGSE